MFQIFKKPSKYEGKTRKETENTNKKGTKKMARNQDEKPMLRALTDTGRKEIRSASLTMASVADAIDGKQKTGVSPNTTHIDPNIPHVFHQAPGGFQCGGE